MDIFGEQDSMFSHIARLLGGTSYTSLESVLAFPTCGFCFFSGNGGGFNQCCEGIWFEE